ncbi:MAG: hypothetical protein ACLUFH_00570 [Monoglobales bacterium]
MNQHIDEIKIKKIILSGLQTSGFQFHEEIDKVLNGLLQISNVYPGKELKQDVLLTASQYIFAYLQLGFSYLEHKNLFDSILTDMGYSVKEITALQKTNAPIIINKAQVRSLLGRWPASPNNSHTVVKAVEEIMQHISNKEYGTYQYYTAKKDGIYTALYQLNISPDSNIFHDVFRNRYYTLSEKSNT